jgi:predicted transcriptional regulator
MHEIYVRQSIERGLADSEAGRTTSVEEAREKLGLSNELHEIQ